jgi:uncharacterized repeat protein (TIGR03803 family)
VFPNVKEDTTMSSPRIATLVAFASLLSAAPAEAQVTILHSFAGGPNDGQTPVGAPFLSGTTLYGMTLNGGANFGLGTIYRVGTDGAGFSLLHSFAGGLADGQNPHGSLIQSGPTLYGMTGGGGNSLSGGTVFRIGADGSGYGLLHSFTGVAADGERPLGTPVLSGGVMYGLTSSGGAADLGTVFKLSAEGTGFGLLHSFAGGPADGAAPGFSSLVVSGATLYGMTTGGGSADLGTVFKVNSDGTGFTVLHEFIAATGDGWAPLGSLTLVGATLYGMTRQGGGAAGTIFKINSDGSGYQILHTFLGGPTDGANPVGDLLAVGSTLYGTTPTGGANALGTLFKIETDGTGYELLHSFAGGPGQPANPGDLTTDGGMLFGISGRGGASDLGTIYSFPVVVPEPSALLLAGLAATAAIARSQCRKRS